MTHLFELIPNWTIEPELGSNTYEKELELGSTGYDIAFKLDTCYNQRPIIGATYYQPEEGGELMVTTFKIYDIMFRDEDGDIIELTESQEKQIELEIIKSFYI